jgi:hypothetical protein
LFIFFGRYGSGDDFTPPRFPKSEIGWGRQFATAMFSGKSEEIRMTRTIWSTITGSVLAAGLIGAVVTVAVSSSPVQAEPDPEPEIDPVELFQSAEKLNTKEATALAQFLQSSAWGVARKGYEWTFTGTAVPIGAYTPNPIIEDDTTVLPDGIYWVGEAGELKAGGDAYWFDANQLFIVGEAWAGKSPSKGVTCRDGWYACCYFSASGKRGPVAVCIENGTAAAADCVSGGVGAVSCDLAGTADLPVRASVATKGSHYTICTADENGVRAVSKAIEEDQRAAEGSIAAAECSVSASVVFYQGEDLTIENPEGQD